MSSKKQNTQLKTVEEEFASAETNWMNLLKHVLNEYTLI